MLIFGKLYCLGVVQQSVLKIKGEGHRIGNKKGDLLIQFQVI